MKLCQSYCGWPVCLNNFFCQVLGFPWQLCHHTFLKRVNMRFHWPQKIFHKYCHIAINYTADLICLKKFCISRSFLKAFCFLSGKLSSPLTLTFRGRSKKFYQLSKSFSSGVTPCVMLVTGRRGIFLIRYQFISNYKTSFWIIWFLSVYLGLQTNFLKISSTFYYIGNKS